MLEEELAALPPGERGAVVLCHLRGRTQRQAAAELGLPFGTFRRQLDRARDRLRDRLEARGITGGAGTGGAGTVGAGMGGAGMGAGALAALLLDAALAAAAPVHPAEAAAVAADVVRRLPPPHVLAPRGPAVTAGNNPSVSEPAPAALSWEPILTAVAGLAVAVLAAVGLFDLLGGGFAEETPPAPAPVVVQPYHGTSEAM